MLNNYGNWKQLAYKIAQKVLNKMKQLNYSMTIKFVNNRYYVKWPWTCHSPNLPINYGLALGRLQSLIKRMDMKSLEMYENILQEQERLGIIEQVLNHKTLQDHPVHYLPHHGVIREGKTTNLRIVYDASAKPNGTYSSLNELLYKGPLLLEDLTALILRFRQHDIGIVADIEKAFLQIGLYEEDRDVTRFLWLNNLSNNKTINEENMICALRVMTSYSQPIVSGILEE